MNFSKLMKREGWTARHLAIAMAVCQVSVYRWMRGENEPTLGISRIKELCELLNCSFDELCNAIAQTKREHLTKGRGTRQY